MSTVRIEGTQYELREPTVMDFLKLEDMIARLPDDQRGNNILDATLAWLCIAGTKPPLQQFIQEVTATWETWNALLVARSHFDVQVAEYNKNASFRIRLRNSRTTVHSEDVNGDVPDSDRADGHGDDKRNRRLPKAAGTASE